jgi:hypothetical protein
MVTTFDAAVAYVRGGFAPIPVPYREKGPKLKGWQDLRLAEGDVPRYFGAGERNIGILNGEPSGDLVDVDLDAEGAREHLDWLPDTGRISGRSGSPASHRFYRAHGIETTQYRDPITGAMLVELRSTGSHTLAPPSVHPSGEAYRWERQGEPVRVDSDELRRRVAIVAADALLARYWPSEGSRHAASLALVGWLCRHGWDQEEAERFVADVARAAGDDECTSASLTSTPP